MSIIRKKHLAWKVWRRTLSSEDFLVLLNLSTGMGFGSWNEGKRVFRLLKRYFKQPLTLEEMNLLCAPAYDLAQDDWLMAKRQKPMTGIEENVMVKYMPWNIVRKFPHKLSAGALAVLFAERDPLKIVAYCREFDLPGDFEMLLIDKYEESLKKPDEKMRYTYLGKTYFNAWQTALEAYLEAMDIEDQRMLYKVVQLRLLDLNDPEVTKKLILRSSIVENRLHEDVIWHLINTNNVEAVRLILRESYLPSNALSDFVDQKMPQLQLQVSWAKIRRSVYLREQKNKVFLGALTFDEREMHLVRKYAFLQPGHEKEYAETYIVPGLGTFKPCMCAWIGYYFPELLGRCIN